MSRNFELIVNDLTMVVLKCPYLNWKNTQTREFFTKMITLKLDGYQRKHFFGVMPIDHTDYVADHLLICKAAPTGDLIPISGVKSLPHDFCEPFRIDFTPAAFFKKDQQLKHLEYVQRSIEDCKKTGRRISYYSSWTQSPEIRKDFKLVETLKQLFAAMTVLHHKEEAIPDLLGLGLPSFKTDAFFYRWGFESVKQNGKDLGNIPLGFLGGIDCVLMHLKNYSAYAESMAEQYSHFWETRVSIGESLRPWEKQEKTAA